MIESSILKAWVIGDFLGYTLNGSKRSHIQGTLKNREPFPDTAPLSGKNSPSWKMPGLYSLLSQIPFLASQDLRGNRDCASELLDAITEGGRFNNLPRGILRETVSTGTDFHRGILTPHPPLHAMAMVAGIVPSLVIAGPRGREILPAAAALFTVDPSLHVLALALSFLLEKTPEELPPLQTGLLIGERSKEFIAAKSSLFFNAGINPQALAEAVDDFVELFQELIAVNPRDRDKVVTRKLSKILRQEITRVDVLHPLGTLAIACRSALNEPGDLPGAIQEALRFGGEASLTGAITAVLTEKCVPGSINDIDTGRMVNRKALFAHAEKLAQGAWRTSDREIFIEQESKLTLKEEEERRAKSKHRESNDRPLKHKKQGKELANNNHQVESWTKADKGRWKRERKRLEQNKNI